MTPDFLLGQLRLALVGFLCFATGKGWLTTQDANAITQIAQALGPIAVIWGWSVYRNFDKRFVPSSTISVQPIGQGGTAPAIGDHVSVGGASVGKVVG